MGFSPSDAPKYPWGACRRGFTPWISAGPPTCAPAPPWPPPLPGRCTNPSLPAPRLDNLEEVAFGPPLPNDHPTLVIVTDGNFNAREINQFLAFEVLL